MWIAGWNCPNCGEINRSDVLTVRHPVCKHCGKTFSHFTQLQPYAKVSDEEWNGEEEEEHLHEDD